MITSTLNALRAMLKTNFPTVTRIYVSKVPDGFVRPSFFVDLVFDRPDELSRWVYEGRVQWQITYFADEDNSGNPDAFAQYEMLANLMNALTASPSITGPDGVVYQVEDVQGSASDEVHVNATLVTDILRTDPETSGDYDDMGEVAHDINIE